MQFEVAIDGGVEGMVLGPVVEGWEYVAGVGFMVALVMVVLGEILHVLRHPAGDSRHGSAAEKVGRKLVVGGHGDASLGVTARGIHGGEGRK